MQQAIQNYLQQIKIGRIQTYKNLIVFPLLSPVSLKLDYILLDEALEENLIEIEELNEGGSVPELKVVNRSKKMVLLIDGEELVGAKQNRIINTTILIGADSATVIPVSCVEQGRWSYSRADFISQKRVMASNMRAQKAAQVSYCLRSTGTYGADQGAIWDAIEEKAERMDADCPTGAMSSIYEKEKATLEEYRKHFRLIDMQVGALFVINGKVSGLDSLGKPETFSKVFGKLVESYALDAIDWFDPEKEPKSKQSDVREFIDKIRSAEAETHKSVSLGTDVRLDSRSISGFALILDNELLHLSAFPRQRNRNHQETRSSRIERFAQRRRNRR